MTEINSLREIIQFNSNFKTAINLYLSLNKAEKVLGYIPTKSSVSFLGEYLKAVLENKEQATLLVGPYGKGKSHLLLVLLAVLSMERTPESESVINELIDKVSKTDEVGERVSEYIGQVWDKKRFLPVLITDTTGDLNQAFLYGLNDALKRDRLLDLAPETYYSIALDRIDDWEQNYFETYKMFERELTQNGMNIAELKTDLKQYSKKALILFKEILIAGIALLAVPKNINLNIENIIGTNKFLPVGTNRGLNRSKETVNQLNSVSKVVKEMADTYKNVAATAITEDDIKEKNKQKFITELLNNIEYMESNILYDTIEDVDGKIVDDIFSELMDKQFIKENDLLRILARNNNYVVGFDKNDEKTSRDVEKMMEAINSAFRISKMNFIWSERLNEEKRNFETQLNGVSKAISEIADNMEEEFENDDIFNEKREQIELLLKQKEIFVQDLTINKKENERYKIEIYIEKTENEDVENIVKNIIDKVLDEKVIIQRKNKIKSENLVNYSLISDDKYILDIGHSIAIKDNMTVSGDSIIQTKLKDGKYLIAISDGMGSGPEARKSSQIVTSMLKRLLNSGFQKNTSVDLINSNLLNVADDVFATLDIAIVDLYKGNIEFIKNGACPTYIKNNKKIQIIKSLTLPAGIVKNASTDVFDKDIENNDIIVMCSDGVLDSNIEYKNKELWVKYLLEDMEVTNPQKIADIILNESVDNNFGKIKDDMSVVVCKFIKKV